MRFVAFVAVLSSMSFADIITDANWDGHDGMGNFSNAWQYYGQTFTVDNVSGNVFNELSFYIKDANSTPENSNVLFDVSIYEWNGMRPTGDALYHSDQVHSILTPDFQEYSFNLNALELQENNRYIWYIKNDPIANGSGYFGGFNSSNPYSGGEMVAKRADELGGNWIIFGHTDLAFRLSSSPAQTVPEPSSLSLLFAGLCMLSLVGLGKAFRR